MPETGFGIIEAFEDFTGAEVAVAGTTAAENLGWYLRVVGQGIEVDDSGVVILESDGLGGVAQLTTTDEDNHSLGLVTATMWAAGSMGTLVAECRVRFADLETKEFFFGYSDLNTDVASLEAVIAHGATETLTLTASDICGFLLSAELTQDEMWHAIFNGGATTGVTDSTANELVVDAVAGEFNVLRLEIERNGTARWYIDGVLRKTVQGAVSTSVALAAQAILEIKGSDATETAELDYIWLRGRRDWTR
jgi:hypothetical protein